MNPVLRRTTPAREPRIVSEPAPKPAVELRLVKGWRSDLTAQVHGEFRSFGARVFVCEPPVAENFFRAWDEASP